jgi:hypothetical protein
VSKKKIQLPSKKLKELKGFEEAIDLLVGDADVVEKKPESSRNRDSYALFNFLENEHERLKKLDQLFSSQIHHLLEGPNLTNAVKMQKQEAARLKEELVLALKEPNSPMHAKLDQIYQNLFF